MLARVTLTRQAENADFTASVEESRIIAKQQIVINDGILPPAAARVETTTTLTLSQYNAIIRGPNEFEVDSEIPVEEPPIE